LGVPLVVGSVEMALLQGYVAIGGISLDAPEGFEGPLFTMNKASVQANLGSLPGAVVIDVIKADTITIVAEMDEEGNINFLKIPLLDTPADEAAAEEPAAEEKNSGEAMPITVKQVDITKVKIRWI